MTRKAYRSSLSDSVHPGGPTTMDVLMRWMTMPGNAKRWRMEAHGPLIREVVETMQDEGLAHRKAPFVRYKLDAMEKQYVAAKQWLLETGMHDAYVRGKAAKEVRVQVESVCPQFKRLDVAFRGLPFSKKSAETIDLDGESTDDLAAGRGGEDESGDEGEEAGGAEVDKRDEQRDKEQSSVGTAVGTKEGHVGAKELTSNKALEANAMSKALLTKGTFKHRLFSSMGKAAQNKALASIDLQKKLARTPGKEGAVGKEKAVTLVAQQPKTAALSLSAAIVDGTAAEHASTPTTSQKNKSNNGRHQSLSAAVDLGMEQAAPKAGVNTLVLIGKKKRGRPSKVAAAVPVAAINVEESAMMTNERKEMVSKAIALTHKRKVLEKEQSVVKRTRVQERDGTDGQLLAIEREALLKRVKDEQKQRYEVYELERAKLDCELKSKQVQLLFEKASARKKLDQLGVSQEEIDRILPL
ncbi:unnamed protein product [Hyaloperonospora brassicae]|uniref:No apical meristem-associated C-terminal domain-containing protein n=1 Tax=Hyaloperonospora brassicae TaxID=162125 RepID=A0AAV0UDP7_HYABA|nr:unnamed protein product [Hyaloperonospora brassicae]